jgi:hypothetical protein
MTTPSNPLPSHIVVHGNCVDCGRPVEFDPTPFSGAPAKPLAPGNTRLHMEMPDEMQHKRPERCEECKLAHHMKLANPTETIAVAHRDGGGVARDGGMDFIEMTICVF